MDSSWILTSEVDGLSVTASSSQGSGGGVSRAPPRADAVLVPTTQIKPQIMALVTNGSDHDPESEWIGDQRTSTRSTTKMRVSPGLMRPPAPRSPYPRCGGI